jgi:hypothetical protein
MFTAIHRAYAGCTPGAAPTKIICAGMRCAREHCAMSKRALKKSKRGSKAVVPALGIAGLFLSLASGATASTGEATTKLPATSQPHELFFAEEEIFDSSLSTFYTFDKENAGANSLARHLKLAAGCGGGCGCTVGCACANVSCGGPPTWAPPAQPTWTAQPRHPPRPPQPHGQRLKKKGD